MAYDCETVIDRRHTHSMKWDVPEGVLPMWVADMDFPVAPEIREALAARMAHPVYGYSTIPESWHRAYADWWRKRHHFEMDPDGLIFCTGVVPAISSIVRKLTTPNENVLIQTPVYNIFFNSILNNGCRVSECPLVYDGTRYSMDFGDLEVKLADPQTTLMIVCNPHNPVGRIWSRDELARIGRLCTKHHVTVISDEIHCDLTTPGVSYVPFASVNEDCRRCSITCIAPTKAFNLAGLQTAAVYVPDEVLRHKVWRALNTDEVVEPNVLAVTAAEAAFNHGEKWLDALREVIDTHKRHAADVIARDIPGLRAVDSQATYLLWIDVSRITPDASRLAQTLLDEAGLMVSNGGQYGFAGKSFLRWNLACPGSVVNEGLRRLARGVAAFVRH